MRSKPNNVNDTLKINSSSIINNVKRSINRGSYVEKSSVTCGKHDKKSAKLCGKTFDDYRSHIAETKANALIKIFNAPYCRNYFIKCAYHLNDDYIDYAIKQSTQPNIVSPVKYFNRMTKAELIKLGY